MLLKTMLEGKGSPVSRPKGRNEMMIGRIRMKKEEIETGEGGVGAKAETNENEIGPTRNRAIIKKMIDDMQTNKGDRTGERKASIDAHTPVLEAQNPK